MNLTDVRLALHDLVQAYAISVDSGDEAAFADCFAPDATLTTINPAGEVQRRYDGRAEIAVIPSRVAQYAKTLHHVTTHRAEVDGDGDTATGITYCSAHHITVVDGRATDKVLDIRYLDRYTRTDGRWRIQARDVCTDWVSEHDVTR